MKLTLFTTILFVVSAWAAAVPAPELVARSIYTVYPSNQCLLKEAYPNTAFGLSFQGQIQDTTQDITTLVGFQMPSTDYSGHTCQLIFQYPFALTGSKQFSLFSFVPSSGNSFNSAIATFNQRTGYRNNDEGAYTVTTSTTYITEFQCPGPSTYLNYELVPTNGVVDIEWYQYNGLLIQVV